MLAKNKNIGNFSKRNPNSNNNKKMIQENQTEILELKNT